MAVATQKGRYARIFALEIPVGVVAAGSYDCVHPLMPVVGYGYVGLNLAQDFDHVMHQHLVLVRRLDQCPVTCGHDAHQVEKTYQRNVARHDYGHVGMAARCKVVSRKPCFEFRPVEHLVAYRPDGVYDVVGCEPPVFAARRPDRPARIVVFTERCQTCSQL